MAHRGFGEAPLDMRRHGKWRVHQHDGGTHRRIEMVVDVSRVMPRDGNVLKQLAEQAGARRGEFVEDQMTASQLGEDGKQARSGRGFQHQVGGRDRGGRAGHQAERNRSRELLQRLALLRAAGVRRQHGRHLGQHREQGGRGIGPRPHRRTELAQEQHLRGFACLIGGLPVPDAIGVGTAKAHQHGGAQRLGIDGAAAFEIGQQQSCGGDDGGGGIKQRRCGRERGRGGEETVHGEMSGRAGNGKSRRGALSDAPPAQTRPGQTLTLNARHAGPACCGSGRCHRRRTGLSSP